MGDWLFGFLEKSGAGEVIYAEDDGVVTIDKRPRCPHCSGILGKDSRHCEDCKRFYHVACFWRHPCKNGDV